MKKILLCCAATFTCLWLLPFASEGQAWDAEAGSGDSLNIVLQRMTFPPGFYPSEKAILEVDFMNALQRTGTFHIVNRDQMELIVEELKFQASDMVDEERTVELGRLAGANHFVTFSVVALRGIYQLTAKLISVETGEVDRIVVRRCENRFDFLPALCNEIAYDLAGIQDRKGTVRIETDPRGAEVLLFGILQGTSPVRLSLAPGPYLFTVKKPGYRDRRKTLQVSSAQESAWNPRLYKKQNRRLREYIGGKSFWEKD